MPMGAGVGVRVGVSVRVGVTVGVRVAVKVVVGVAVGPGVKASRQVAAFTSGAICVFEQPENCCSSDDDRTGFMMKVAGSATQAEPCLMVVRGAEVVAHLVRQQQRHHVERGAEVLGQAGAPVAAAQGAQPGDADDAAAQIATGHQVGDVGAVEDLRRRVVVVVVEGAELVQQGVVVGGVGEGIVRRWCRSWSS